MRLSAHVATRAGLTAAIIGIAGAASCVRSIGSGRRHSEAGGSRPTAVPASPGVDPPGVPVLHVGNDVLRRDDVWRGEWDRLEQLRQGAPADLPDRVRRETAGRINRRVNEMLLYQRASLRISEQVEAQITDIVDARVRGLVAERYGGVLRRYEKELEARGSSLQEVREQLRRETIISSYLDAEIRPKILEPTRAELIDAFEQIKDSYARPERRRMSLLDVRVTRHLPRRTNHPTREERATAREKARSETLAARQELLSGTPFADVARRHSDGLHASEGGSWGWIDPDSVRARFQPAVDTLFQLEAESISDVIETSDGFFVVRCDEIDPGREASFEAMQPELKRWIRQDRFNTLVARLVADLRNKAQLVSDDIEKFHRAVVPFVVDRLGAGDGPIR